MKAHAIGIVNRTENSITFNIEELSKPEKVLETNSAEELLTQFAKKIEKHSINSPNLVNMGYHPFMMGLYKAYADHRPFTISADMIWLLILQGFSTYLNYNKDGKKVFAHFQKQKLSYFTNEIQLGNPESHWEKAPDFFVEEMKAYLPSEFEQLFATEFSTTTPASKIATSITIMDCMKAYFEYEVCYCVCGIPQITLQGKPSDWDKIIDNLSILAKFQLQEWANRLRPIILQLKKTASGVFDQKFWMNIFKIHTYEVYGNPKSIDGWITDFFPFDQDGNPIDLKQHNGLLVEDLIKGLPKEIVSVDFTYNIVTSADKVLESHKMEFKAGFLGLEQDEETFQLTPHIGWLVNHKSEKIPSFNNSKHIGEGIVYKNITSFDEIWEDLKEKVQQGVYEVSILYLGELELPEKLFELPIQHIQVYGEISTPEAQEYVKNLMIKSLENEDDELYPYLKVNDIDPYDFLEADE